MVISIHSHILVKDVLLQIEYSTKATVPSDSYVRKDMQVQVLLPAPNGRNPNQILPIGDGFGFLFVFGDM